MRKFCQGLRLLKYNLTLLEVPTLAMSIITGNGDSSPNCCIGATFPKIWGRGVFRGF